MGSNNKATGPKSVRMTVIVFSIVIAVSAINPSSLIAAPVVTQWEVAANHAGLGEIFSTIAYSYVEPRTSSIAKLRVTTSEPLDPNTVSNSVVTIHSLQSGDISSMIADVNLGSGGTQITVELTGSLLADDSYSVKLSSSIKSVGDEPLSGNRTVGITPFLGDIDNSGSIDLVDMIGVRNNFGSVNTTNARYDLDVSGTIDSTDLVIARVNLGETGSVPDYVSVSPYKAWIPDMNETRQLLVSVHCTTGDVLNFTAPATGTMYESSDPCVATVSVDGLITPIADGETTVTAAIFGLTDTCNTRVIATPAIATSESGWIDGIVYDANTDTPLEDAIITVQDVNGRVLSDPNGKFAFPTPGSGFFFTTIYKDGYTYHQRRVKVTRTLDSAVYSAYLLPQAEPLFPAGSGMMSMAGGSLDSPLDSTQTGQVYTNQSGTIQMVFPAGSRFAKAAVAAQQMTLNGDPPLPPPQIIATQVTRSIELPDALPEQSEFAYAFFFDIDGEDELAEPATIRFTNTLGFAAGAQIPVGWWNDNLLKWVHAGVATVTADGLWVEYQAAHFSAHDINPPPLPPIQARSPDKDQGEDQSNENDEEGGKDCTGNGSSFIAARTGELFEDHTLPSYRSVGENRTVRLVYQSRAAKPAAFIAYDLELDTGTTLVPEAHGFRVSIEGRLVESWMQGTEGSRRHAFMWNGINKRGELLPTGCYSYYLWMTNEYRSNFATSSNGMFAGPPGQDLGVEAPERVVYPSSTYGTVVLENDLCSPFGAGWTIDGLQRLLIEPGQRRATIVQGDGAAVTFGTGKDLITKNFDILWGLWDPGELPPVPSFSLLLGNGDGTFQNQQESTIDITYGGIEVDDFDADSKQDIVIFGGMESGVGIVNVFLGEGDGTFHSTYQHNVGWWTDVLVVEDFDGDAVQDLAFVKRYSGWKNYQSRLQIELGNGDGTFTDFWGMSTGYKVIDLEATDLNGDSHQDLLMVVWYNGWPCPHGDKLYVALGNGDGTFQPPIAYGGSNFPIKAQDSTASDFNGDGRQDVALIVTDTSASPDLSYVWIMLGNGDGTLANPQEIALPSVVVVIVNFSIRKTIEADDFNGDGRQDLAIVLSSSDAVAVLLGNGDGSFGDPVLFGAGVNPKMLVLGDFDGDRQQDIAITNPDSNNVSILLGDGEGAFIGPRQFTVGNYPLDFAVGDFDMTNGVFVSPPGEYSQLQRDPNYGTYTRTMKDGTIHHFDPNGFIADTIDRNGNTTSYEYIEDGNDKKIWRITDAAGLVTVFDYNDGKLQSITDPASRTTQFEINDSNDLVKITNPDGTFRAFEYNSNHLLTAQVDANGTRTEYVYDNYGCVTEVIKAVGTPDEQHRYFQAFVNQGLINDLPPGVGTRNNPAPVVSPNDIRESYTNGEGETEYYYTNRFGSRTVIEDPCGRTIQMERDSFNQVSRITYPKGNQISYEYDRTGNLTKITNHGVTPSAVTLIEYDPNWNRPTRIEDPNHHVTLITYDPCNGNLLTITDPNSYTTTFTYNEYGQPEMVTNAEGEVVQFVFYEPNDANDPNGRGNLHQMVVDPNGLGLTTTLEYDLIGNISKITDANGNDTTYIYDVMNNLLRFVTDAENQTTEYQYQTALGTISRWSSAPLAALTKIVDANSSEAAVFTYDNLHRLKTETNALSKSRQYAYDDADRLTSASDANGQTITYAYDDMGQLITKTLPTSGGPEEVTYEYDLNGNLTRIADNDSDLSFGYDNTDRLVSYSSAAVASQPALSLTYSYDADSTPLSMTDPTGTTVYNYNANRWLTQISDPASRITGFSHDQVGRRTSMTHHNATTISYTYDNASRLTDIVHDLSAVPFLSFAYTRDAVGNILTMTDNDGLHSYSYDSIYQLTSAVHPNAVVNPNESFSYDPVGNRLISHLSNSYSHNNANQMLEDDDYTYTYDDNGNLATKTAKVGGAVTTYTYDAENHLIRVNLPSSSWAQYRYDALGRRIEKDVNGIKTRYTYSGEDILFEYDGSNSILARYTHGPRIDEPLIMDRSGQAYYYHTDHLGTIRAVTDVAGIVAQTYTYDSFGRIVAQTGAIQNPYTFTAREWDQETGLYYYRARYYSPITGRFLQTDPFGFTARTNRYSYVANKPLGFIDPFGLQSEPFPGGDEGQAMQSLKDYADAVQRDSELLDEMERIDPKSQEREDSHTSHPDDGAAGGPGGSSCDIDGDSIPPDHPPKRPRPDRDLNLRDLLEPYSPLFLPGGGGGGGGGCPYLFVHNGIKYLEDNNLLHWTGNADGSSRYVTDFYKLEQPLIPSNGKYRLLVREFEKEHSYIDRVQLMTVDHPRDVDIAVTKEGGILTYSSPLRPMSCKDRLGKDRSLEIRDLKDGYFDGHEGDSLTLNWGKLVAKVKQAKLIFYADGTFPGDLKTPFSIHIQIKNESGKWSDIGSFLPRENWATDVIDISKCLPKLENNIQIRLVWTANHKLDYIGLDVSEARPMKINLCPPILAKHSTGSSVLEYLLKKDDKYAEIIPGEEIVFQFDYKPMVKDMWKRDFILVVDGYYVHIGQKKKK